MLERPLAFSKVFIFYVIVGLEIQNIKIFEPFSELFTVLLKGTCEFPLKCKCTLEVNTNVSLRHHYRILFLIRMSFQDFKVNFSHLCICNDVPSFLDFGDQKNTIWSMHVVFNQRNQVGSIYQTGMKEPDCILLRFPDALTHTP